jgi:hypothetical protein
VDVGAAKPDGAEKRSFSVSPLAGREGSMPEATREKRVSQDAHIWEELKHAFLRGCAPLVFMLDRRERVETLLVQGIGQLAI